MRLNALQGELERRYDVQSPHRVEDFLFHDRRLAGQLSGDPSLAGAPEALLIDQADGDLDVSLFVDPTVIEQLQRDDPLGGLHDGNLAAFWIALEGVSHFLYLVWSAALDRCVTQLEMELQAEVDKFVVAANWFKRQRGRVPVAALRRCLFVDIDFRSSLDAVGLQRYHEANRLADRYCAALTRVASRSGDWQSSRLSAELRRFYRMSQGQKIHHIACC